MDPDIVMDEGVWDADLQEIYETFDDDIENLQEDKKLPHLFEEAAQAPPKEMFLQQLYTNITSYTEQFANSLKEYQAAIQVIQSNFSHHQTNQTELVQPLQLQFLKDMETTHNALTELFDAQKTYILTPLDIHKMQELTTALTNQEITIQFFQSELSELLRGNPLKGRLLLIKEQPAPHVVFKSKMIEDRYVIQLVTSLPDALMQSQKDTKIVASVYSEDNNPLKGKTVLTNNSVNVTSDKQAIFQGMKVQISTRMSLAHLFFELKNKANVTLACTRHDPRFNSNIVVITNESQWCEAQGKLIVQDCFPNTSDQVPWTRYANDIHRHFLKTSRQDLTNFSRCILPHEFAYLHHKYFDNSPMITSHQSSAFWMWLGPVSCALRFKRHINTLWFHGLIYGLISKRDCELLLGQQRVGTFVIRFSESYPGFFAVSYVTKTDQGDVVMHYLVDHTDIGSQKTLPDFLRSKEQFKYLAQLTPNTGQLVIYEKDAVLGQYYSKGKFLAGKHEGYAPLNPV
uniref:SH2 domain-containing protein n=1 Tax=Vannella robusta TaxID=1487602 RepID=A0A7S4IMC2_9EUKA|mmetsp:Transcript_4960/g.6056  ORF Transcript_4960/g.6056 Transcript_4960/m.6056 type:complete len:514 (+) Transcript_4960:79-1620(+)